MSEFDAIKEAKKLKKETPIVPVHRTMDGALNGYSVIKSVFDIQHCTEGQMDSLDAMHEWIATPAGLAVTLGTSALFTAFAFRAGRDENAGKNTWAFRVWGDSREALQAGRNGFKAVRGGILTAAAFTTRDLSQAILPSSLAFGAFYMGNRLYMRWENEKRKKMVSANQHLFADLMHYGTFLTCSARYFTAKEPSSFKNCCVRVEYPDLKFINYDKHGRPPRNKDDEIEFVKNRYIFYKNPKGKEELYYADCDGKVELIPDANIPKIKDVIRKTHSSDDHPHLSLLQLNELLPPNVAKRHFSLLKKQEIKFIPPSKKNLYYLIRAFNGLIDGMYLYLGIVLGVASFSPPVMLVITVISALYCLLCVASRVYEEYQNQQQLLITKYRVELASAARGLELCLIELNEITGKISRENNKAKIKSLELTQKKLDEKLEKYLEAFAGKRSVLRSSYYLSKTETFLLGIKHSLPFYGALISFLFALVFIGFMIGFTIPPVGVLITIGAGLPILATGIIHAFLKRRKPSETLIIEDKQKAAKLSKIVQEVKASYKLTYKSAHEEYEAFIKGAYAKQAFLDWIVKGLQADPLADEYYADYAEVGRSFWAGLSKGRKAIEMILNRFQRRDETGHYQDTRLMYIAIIPVAAVYAVVFAANAFVKGLTRKAEDKENFKGQELDIADLEKQRARHIRDMLRTASQPSVQHPLSKDESSQTRDAGRAFSRFAKKSSSTELPQTAFHFFKPEQRQSSKSIAVAGKKSSSNGVLGSERSSSTVLKVAVGSSEEPSSVNSPSKRKHSLFSPVPASSPRNRPASTRIRPSSSANRLLGLLSEDRAPSPVSGPSFGFDPMSMCFD